MALDDIIMSVLRDAASGRWQVVGDDGSVLEDGFSTHAAAWRWIDDRSGDGVRDAATHASRPASARRRTQPVASWRVASDVLPTCW